MSGGRAVGVLGGGAWGTALACAAARAGPPVRILVRDEANRAAINERRENEKRLAGLALPDAIEAVGEAAELDPCDVVLLAVPAQQTRNLLNDLAELLAGRTLIACAKGIERGTAALQSEIVAETVPGAMIAALSGPGFATDVVKGLPTAVTLAAPEAGQARSLSRLLSSATFRIYANDDLVGVELGGALKNVLAIGAGIIEGRGLGESARAALIARGLAEMSRLAVACGGRRETLAGLSGLGDLVLTATSRQSRNLCFGHALGEGHAVAEMLATGQPLAEGAHTAGAALALARKHGVDLPITAAVADVVEGRRTIEACIDDLVNRPLRMEE